MVQIKQFKWPSSIFVWTGAYLKIIEKKLICEAQKTEGRFDPKNFFRLFIFRRLEGVFQDEKKKFSKILENSRLNFFLSWKTLSSLLHIKSQKSFFLGQISLQFFFCVSQISLFFYDLKISTSSYKNAQRSFKLFYLEPIG